MFYTYILKSLKSGSYYVGSCEDMDKRLDLHNQGQIAVTKGYKPWKLVYLKKYTTLSQAVERERRIKSLKSKGAIEKLVQDFRS